MGKPSTADHIARTLIFLVMLFCLANGAFMIAAPLAWYHAIPTVPPTGPPNAHFIVDIGLSYLASGVLLLYGLGYPEGRWLALVAGALWLTLHGLFHVYEVVAGVSTVDRFRADIPGVLGPPLLVFVALGILVARQRITPAGLPKRTFLKLVARLTPEESQYFEELGAARGHALEKFMHFMPATMHRFEADADIFHMARIAVTLAADCGLCAMIAANGALADGVARELVNEALAGGHNLRGDHLTAFQFGHAIATHSPEAFALGDLLEHRLGRPVRLELALTAALVSGYPALKRGLGLSKSCSLTRLAV